MIFNWPCTHTHTHALPSSVDPGALLALYLQTVRWLYRSCMAAPITKHDKWGRPLSHYLYGNHCAANKRTTALDCYWHNLCHASHSTYKYFHPVQRNGLQRWVSAVLRAPDQCCYFVFILRWSQLSLYIIFTPSFPMTENSFWTASIWMKMSTLKSQQLWVYCSSRTRPNPRDSEEQERQTSGLPDETTPMTK